MKIIRCFLFFGVMLSFLCDKNVFADEEPLDDVELGSSLTEEEGNEEKSESGAKKFDEPNHFEQESSNANVEDTSSIINENAPEIKKLDISPEQELLMAATQDSSYQEANIGGVNGQDIGTLRRTMGHTSTPDRQEEVDINSQDVLDNDDSLSSDSLLRYGNFLQNGADSEDLGDNDDSLEKATKERHLINYPAFQSVRPFQPLFRAPRPYPATIHVRLPGDVHTMPRVYPVHHYRHVPIPVRYHKVQNIDSPYYVPYKEGPDVDETHFDVFQPVSPCKNGGVLLSSHGGMSCLCTREYHGKFCDEKLYCSSSPCLFGGICQDITNNYRCQCPKGYRGYNCEVRDVCALSPCKNDGTCVETLNGYKCICRFGFTGEHCESPDMCEPNPCKNWGTCVQNHPSNHECHCTPHFKGPLCETRRVCYANPCRNGGKCVEDGGRYPCICPHGYKLPFCREHVCSHHPCLNGGKCVAYGSTYGWKHKCVCPLLYRGDNCETPNPCVTNPCLNGGRCIDSSSEYSGFPGDWNANHLHYICICPPGYFGPKCEDNICLKCHQNATCIGNHCVCIDGFYGDGFLCHRIKDPCVPNPCFNDATCTHGPDESYDCHCRPGYIPPLCKEKDPCVPNPCKNGATCKRDVVIHAGHIHVESDYKCFCPPGFAPPDCTNKTTNPCEPNPCLNGGTCREDPKKPGGFYCICPPVSRYFSPPLCGCSCPQGDLYSKPPILPSKCDLTGEECTCPDDYVFAVDVGCKSGASNPCFSSPCLNGGTCIDVGQEWKCKCPKNCTGINCNKCDFCPPDYCYNGGTCFSVGQKPLCRCKPGFLPPRCLKPKTTIVYRCHPNPCHNGGRCTERHDGYDCHCNPPYDGPHCERDKCMDCDVNAKCVLGVCKCRKGFRGSGYKGDCIQESGCDICPVNAMCIDNGCKCVPGFMLVKKRCIPILGHH